MCGGWSETKRVGGSERPSSRIGAPLSLRRINRGGRPWSECGSSEDWKKKKNTILCILSSDIRRPFVFSTARRLIVVKYNEVSWDFYVLQRTMAIHEVGKTLAVTTEKGFSGFIKKIENNQAKEKFWESEIFLFIGWHIARLFYFSRWTREAEPTASCC